MSHRFFAILLVIILALGFGGGQASGSEPADASITTITLRSTVRLSHEHTQLTLGDLATIIGPQASALTSLPLSFPSSFETGQWHNVKMDSIRELVDSTNGIHAGSVILSGNDVSVIRQKQTKAKTTTLITTNDQSDTYEGPTLQSHLEQWIYTRLRTQADTTRIRFDNRYASLLATPTAGRLVEIAETGRSTQMHLRITVYEHGQTITNSTLRVDVQVQRSVRVATKLISRRAIIDNELSRVELRWLSPTLPIADPEQSIGFESKTSIKPGQIILDTMLAKPILVKRGQLVSAKSFVGRTIVTKVVRSRENGQMGDLIELESKDRSSRFTARVAGPGQVVIIEKSASAG